MRKIIALPTGYPVYRIHQNYKEILKFLTGLRQRMIVRCFENLSTQRQLLETSDTSMSRDNAILASINESIDVFNYEIEGLCDIQLHEY